MVHMIPDYGQKVLQPVDQVLEGRKARGRRLLIDLRRLGEPIDHLSIEQPLQIQYVAEAAVRNDGNRIVEDRRRREVPQDACEVLEHLPHLAGIGIAEIEDSEPLQVVLEIGRRRAEGVVDEADRDRIVSIVGKARIDNVDISLGDLEAAYRLQAWGLTLVTGGFFAMFVALWAILVLSKD